MAAGMTPHPEPPSDVNSGSHSPLSPNPLAGGSEAVADPLTCARCGYDLRYIDPQGLCPECGFSIPESRRLVETVGQRRWLRKLRWGLALLAVAYTITQVQKGAYVTLLGTTGLVVARIPMWWSVLSGLYWVRGVLETTAVVLVTAKPSSARKKPLRARLARWFTLLAVVLHTFRILAMMFGVYGPARSMGLLYMSMSMSLVSYVALLVWLVQLAGMFPMQTAVDRFRLVLYTLTVLGAAQLGMWLIRPTYAPTWPGVYVVLGWLMSVVEIYLIHLLITLRKAVPAPDPRAW
ncbi:MAG: hypothetical protein IT436_18045 [Phycisphaerales bacterium]|nr:hypothetical protein [Phycisphaerales bacterium]